MLNHKFRIIQATKDRSTYVTSQLTLKELAEGLLGSTTVGKERLEIIATCPSIVYCDNNGTELFSGDLLALSDREGHWEVYVSIGGEVTLQDCEGESEDFSDILFKACRGYLEFNVVGNIYEHEYMY